MDTIFKWVHMSDIHFQTKDEGIQTDLLREKLCEYLKDSVSGCNALFLSGDYRFAKSGEKNPKKCSDYIIKLAETLGIENEQIIAVPGNHDLERGTVRDCLIDGALKNYNTMQGIIDQEIITQLIQGFGFYTELCDSIKGIHYLTDRTLPHSIIHLDECDVLMLNTSLICGRDGESRKLVLGSNEVNKILREHQEDIPIIAVGHHSLNELTEDEQKTIEQLFGEKGVQAYLCGHAHLPNVRKISDVLREVTVGCMKQEGKDVIATFSVGEIKEDGSIVISSHKWDPLVRNWFQDPPRNDDWKSPHNLRWNQTDKKWVNALSRTSIPASHSVTEPHTNIDAKPAPRIEKRDNPLSIIGYSLLGGLGVDGIKYLWSKGDSIVESVALNKRLRNSNDYDDLHTSAYTISTSIGCHLAAIGKQCRFCETGTLQFGGPLSARDIALQCVFMAEYDQDCPSFLEVRENAREFAFMGQGEPGYNYPAIKSAIQMTDYVMERLGENVSRYIISTCGVADFMPSLIQDIKSKVYKNKVTVHFSLHEIGENRQELMPIESLSSYTEFIEFCNILYGLTGEKIGVGILMFDHYKPSALNGKTYTLTPKKLKEILNCLDNDIFRIDLCAVNKTSAGQQSHQQSKETAIRLLDIVKQAGFEGKIFTSFGDKEQAGCGMLSSSAENMENPGDTTIAHFNRAVELVLDAENHFSRELRRTKMSGQGSIRSHEER